MSATADGVSAPRPPGANWLFGLNVAIYVAMEVAKRENADVHGLPALSESCATATRRSVAPAATP
jgi:hypothetical protein